MTAHDTQSAAAIWWEALQVMGGEPSEWTGDRWTIEVGSVTLLWNKPLGLFAQWNAMAGQYGEIDHWNLFGLAVEWIEARGCDAMEWDREGTSSFGFFNQKTGRWMYVYGFTDLPTAAARWVVEHGAKIAKEPTP